MVVINMNGKVESVIDLDHQKTPRNLDIHSFGIMNVKGNYIIKNGGAFGLSSLDMENMKMKNLASLPPLPDKDPYFQAGDAYAQGLLYRPDAKTLLIARTINGNQASIIAVENFEGK